MGFLYGTNVFRYQKYCYCMIVFQNEDTKYNVLGDTVLYTSKILTWRAISWCRLLRWGESADRISVDIWCWSQQFSTDQDGGHWCFGHPWGDCPMLFTRDLTTCHKDWWIIQIHNFAGLHRNWIGRLLWLGWIGLILSFLIDALTHTHRHTHTWISFFQSRVFVFALFCC